MTVLRVILLLFRYNKKGGKSALILSILVSVVGNFMYSFAPLTGWWSLILSRTIVGLGTGTIIIIQHLFHNQILIR